MSNLFKDASLVITPNGVKDGKLYAIKPTDGSGDLTVVRNTTATRVNADGLIEVVPADVPRLDYSNGSCPSILVEPQRTNLLTYSNDFSNGVWLKDAGLGVTSGQVSPTATGNEGWLINDNSANLLGIRQRINISNPTNTGRVTIKKTTVSPDIYALFDILYLTENVLNTDTFFLFNTTTGAFNEIVLGTPAGNPFFRATSLNDNFWVVEWGATDPTGAQMQCQIDLYPAASTNGTTINSEAVGSQIIYGFQLEAGSNATSYIPTVASAVTRNADVISKTGISDLIGQTEGTLYLECMPLNNDLSFRALGISDNTPNNRIQIWLWNNGNIFTYIVSNNIAVYSRFDAVPQNSFSKIALSYKENNFATFINGVKTFQVDSGVLPINLSSIRFSDTNNTANFNSKVKQFQIYKTKLTDQECINLTTI
jgi:hypothetical protein